MPRAVDEDIHAAPGVDAGFDHALAFAFRGDVRFKELILNAAGFDKRFGARITSYNVCYTKLLRRIQIFDARTMAIDLIGSLDVSPDTVYFLPRTSGF